MVKTLHDMTGSSAIKLPYKDVVKSEQYSTTEEIQLQTMLT